MLQLIQTILQRMINLRSLLALTTNNNLQGPNMPSTHIFYLVIKTCAFLIICYVANPESAIMSSYLKFYHTIWVRKQGEIIRQGPYFDHIMLQ